METPSSTTRRITRSQALAVANGTNNIPISRKHEDSEKGVSKSRQRSTKQQQALIDITNDSPIVGVARGSLETQTPSSAIAKQKKSRATPGSGEALLRGQVKTLLQKVEEEADLSKMSRRPFLHLYGFVNSPTQLLAPTPANTPQLFHGMNPSPIIEEQVEEEPAVESEKNVLSRSLLSDFSEKSELSDSSECSSVVKSCADEDDSSSIWSIEVNAQSTHDQDEEQVIDELCEGISKMNVTIMPKHKRFIYNSDDEIVEQDCECNEDDSVSPTPTSILRFKALPTPKGKHLRFPNDD